MENVHGYTDGKFSGVEQVFRQLFQDGTEFEGAAFAVYHKGQCVVDLWGGYSDFSSLRKWNEKTRTVVFSVSKSVGALCIAYCVDKGYVKYEDKVSSFWPEFAQNGKEDITVEIIMNHQAGLPYFGTDITIEDVQNPDRMAEIIEKSPPLWKPGTLSGYHALTYGWLVDQIIRRVDPRKRGIGKFFKEEIGEKYNIDFHLGLPKEEEYTVARLAHPSFFYLLKEIYHTPKILLAILSMIIFTSILGKYKKTLSYPTWISPAGKHNTVNNPEIHGLEQTAAFGITNAKALAKLFSLMLSGKLISKSTVERFYRPKVVGNDVVVNFLALKAYGFFFEPHPKKPDKFLFGHPGYGGNNLMIDPEEDLVIAYVTNGIKNGMGDMTRSYRLLRNATFDALDKFPKENVSEATFTDAGAAMIE